MKTLIKILLFTYLMVSPGWASAMDFTPLRSINGLPNSEVRRMLIGHDGRLWIATTGGLCFYDGYSYHIYRNSASNPHLLSNNNVRNIAEDNRQRLLIATDKGLDILDQKTGKLWHSRLPQFKGQQIFMVYTTSKGKAFVSLSKHCYLYDIDKDQAQDLKFKGQGLLDAKPYEDSRGMVWLGTGQGLLRYDCQKKSFYTCEEFKKITTTSIICEDRYHRIWVGRFEYGLDLIQAPYRKGNHNIKHISKAEGLLDYCVYALIEDKVNNQMLVGTRSGLSAISLTSDHSIVNYMPGGKNTLPFNEVDALASDGKHTIYIGTLGGGVFFVNPCKPLFSHNIIEPAIKKLATNSVKSLAMIGSNLWMGLGSYGLVVYHPESGKYTFSEEMQGLENYTPMTTLMAIRQMKDGRVMMGSFFHGVYEWKNGKVKVFNCYNTSWMVNDCIYSLLEDRKGNCWIGTFNGLNILSSNGKGKRLKLVVGGKDLSSNMFQTLLLARDGSVWAGTKDAGVLRINPKTLQAELFCDGNGKLSCNDVECIFEDTKGRLWLGTEGGGLYLLVNGKFVSVNDMLRLPVEVVYSILEDNYGRLWAGTNSGMLCLTPAADIDKSLFRLYTGNDWFSDNMFLRGSAYKASDGTLYFGGHNGYIYFNPKKLSGMQAQQQVTITDILVDGQSWYDMEQNARYAISPLTPQFADKIYLKYNQNNFSIDFSAMNLQSSLNEKYSYMVEGYDRTWKIAAKYEHTARYNNMPSGHYRFLLRAMNGNGAWSQNVRVVDITIAPPFWLSWYAYLIYIVVAGLVIWYVYKYAKYRIKRNVKAQFFTNVTNNMFRPLAIVKGNIDYLSSRLPEYADEFKEMQKNVEKQMSLISMEYKNQMSFKMKDVEVHDKDKEFMERALACVEAHLCDENYDVMKMADDMAMGKTTLYKKLKQMTGLSISAFIRNVRLKMACRMLEKEPNSRISDVAYDVGFSSPKYFSRCFKAEFGMLPKEYAEQFAEKNRVEHVSDEGKL